MKFILKLIGLIGLTGLIGLSAKAQTAPEFMITWKANNYAPANYSGKILPIGDTKVDMALELIDGGRLANLSQNEIRWSVNNTRRQSGFGLKSFSFNAERFKGDQIIDIAVLGYRGQNLAKRIIIPLAVPEVIIDGGPNVFRALLYFFNIQNPAQVKFTWSANGNQTVGGAAENPDILNLDTSGLPAGSNIAIGVQAQSLLEPLEIAVGEINITLK